MAVDALSFSYGSDLVLDGVTFSIEASQFVALAGPNGSGKSTLLRVLLGLTPPAAGSCRLWGVDPRAVAERWRIGYVAQRSALADDIPATVREVVMAGRLARRGWWRRLTAADLKAVDEAMETLAVEQWADRRLSMLSGGQQQRALIAKALVAGPDLLILDEPTAGVDADSQRLFRNALVGMVRDRSVTVLLVSHEFAAVADDLDRILVLKQGRIVFEGLPQQLTATGVSLGVHTYDLPVWLEGRAMTPDDLPL